MHAYEALKRAQHCIKILQSFDKSLYEFGSSVHIPEAPATFTAILHDVFGASFGREKPSFRERGWQKADSLTSRFMARVDSRHIRINEEYIVTRLENCLCTAIKKHGRQKILDLFVSEAIAKEGHLMIPALAATGVKFQDKAFIEAFFDEAHISAAALKPLPKPQI